ncbi:MAG: SHOCT domain-containing protein [Solirubrobacterales bacterium]
MGFLLKVTFGAALFIGGTVLFNVKLVELLEVGTCASGNQPFEIARECPEGIETAILLMVGGVFAGLIGGALFLLRGTPPWSRERGPRLTGTFGWATFGWGLFFAGTGATTLIASKTSDAMPADGELGGTIVGITFLVMGVPALALALWGLFSALADRDERPVATSAAGIGTPTGFGGLSAGSMSGALRSARGMVGAMGSSRLGRAGESSGVRGDSVGRLERLQSLREKGALTEQEFEREKAKILAEM